ncbi:alpha/beta hydrolase [Rhodococcus sp. HNM0569]|uniref:alpha/beta fold hydrolase n=1 Tax=Rhodococcus sp. HNM0569 TaxID=2716340 RepID=UPI00146DBB7E|nr:alpha/beta hydrolase [Rhodococcus sp. HNM0569]NLU83984.1 alpha/beta hydrolase [Rhodococcus sp. HNM0569]
MGSEHTASPDESSAAPTSVPVGEFTFRVRFDGPQDGPPVVLLHGFPTTHRSWDAVTPLLTAEGLRTIAPDQRGYSPDARPADVADYDVEHLAGDVVGLLDALGLETAHVVGHDWGAVVAWVTAARHPERVSRLTALSVPHPAAYSWAVREDADQRERASYISLLRQRGKAEHVLLDDGARRLRAMYGDSMPDEYVEAYLDVLADPDALTAALAWYRSMGRELEATPAVAMPTTFVWSSSDVAIGRAGAQRCHEFVDAPYRFVEVTGSHWIPEEQPRRVADAVLTPFD